MKMLLGDSWVDRDERIDVIHPFDGSTVDTVPKATLDDVATALAAAERGAAAMRALTGYQRFQIVDRVADLMRENAEDLARTITLEEGKILAEDIINESDSSVILECGEILTEGFCRELAEDKAKQQVDGKDRTLLYIDEDADALINNTLREDLSKNHEDALIRPHQPLRECLVGHGARAGGAPRARLRAGGLQESQRVPHPLRGDLRAHCSGRLSRLD